MKVGIAGFIFYPGFECKTFLSGVFLCADGSSIQMSSSPPGEGYHKVKDWRFWAGRRWVFERRTLNRGTVGAFAF